jgi:hypothetical protein
MKQHRWTRTLPISIRAWSEKLQSWPAAKQAEVKQQTAIPFAMYLLCFHWEGPGNPQEQ